GPGLDPRRLSRRRIPDHDAADDRARQGPAAPRDRPVGRPAGRRLRDRADRVRALRADGPVRQVAEDPHLVPAVPVLPPWVVPAAEGLPEVGSPEMSDVLLGARNLTV